MRKIKSGSSLRAALLTVLLLSLAVTLSSCGYSNPYARLDDPAGGPAEPVSIFVDMWKNKTSELGLQSEMTQSLTRWLKKSRHFTMAASPDQADYTLRGVIESAHYPGLSYGTFDRAVELRAELTFSFELKKNSTGEIILKKEEAPWHANFRQGRDAATTERNKRQALVLITDDIAERIYINLFHAFSTTGGKKADIPIEQTQEAD
jgi:outer membrane lipopolysaccharide assembly protein LptE/RlpB